MSKLPSYFLWWLALFNQAFTAAGIISNILAYIFGSTSFTISSDLETDPSPPPAAFFASALLHRLPRA
jgi:hypothetical protein